MSSFILFSICETYCTLSQVRKITDRLEEGIRQLFESEQYKAYLTAMSKFHNYSFNNTLLIAMQKPDATLVAGFSKWRDTFHRTVKKGEKGIQILAPIPYKKKVETEKVDAAGQPAIGPDGKPMKEIQEIDFGLPMCLMFRRQKEKSCPPSVWRNWVAMW